MGTAYGFFSLQEYHGVKDFQKSLWSLTHLKWLDNIWHLEFYRVCIKILFFLIIDGTNTVREMKAN